LTVSTSGGRRILATTTSTQDSSTPGSATARAIRYLVEAFSFDALDWLLHELTQLNVKINKISFPSENNEAIFSALDSVLKLAVTIHH
jgi:hypothetical protein